ncbi:hypothetical protein F7725_025198 [Dissostichus mawsoni]|uniref:Choline transporter-like protein n=1 Tax=Dissostichus mawsoni TaxID=36200 RepID=A0A7J5XAF8_DISMA|nr:hypothetical protein F7725_025198 [Dissostichus mawsoni]
MSITGEPAQFDPTFNGPMKKRGCTDIICCILFMAVLLGYIAVGILGRPNLFYFDFIKCATSVNVMANSLNGFQCPTMQVCVESCPSQFWAVGIPSYFPNSVQNIVDKELCPFFYMPQPLWSGNSHGGQHAVPVAAEITAPVMVWVLIVGLLGAGAYGIWHCYWEYSNYKNASATISNIGFTTNFNVYLQVQETWLAFLIIISVAEAIILLTIIFLRTRILIAIAIIKESSKYLATSGGPIYRVVALNSTMNDCKSINGSVDCDPQNFNTSDYPGCPSASCIFIKYNEEGLFQRNLFNLQIYNAVAFLWCVNFVIALGQCTLAGAFASYYWAFNKPDDIPYFPLSASFIRSLRYHVGSLAFGALILTLVQIARMILEYIDHKTRQAQNPCARFVLCCMKCCLWCLEKFIKFLNRNAYIMIAIYGKNFCVSAKNAFMLLMRNVVRVVVLDKVTDLLLFFGKLLVVAGVGVLSFFFFSGRISLPGNTFRTETLNYYWMPIITVVFGSYLIAHGFFMEDLERNDGSLQKPYFMSKNLMKILNKSNKAPKKVKGKE